MASSMLSSATMVASPAQATMVAPFTGLKSSAAFPSTRKANNDITSITSNGGRVSCMKVWPPIGKKKFETLSYLPDLSEVELGKEVDYLLRNKWIPCVEFETGLCTVSTVTPPDTTMEGTGQCGSYPCSDALTQHKC
ncbi:ribulose bisphosphate carboxylase small chain F1, chloroplastic isoform X2 [Capsella rubella]|uniref:ribulose bisphosphate carboxylase small chain F1, chloroplastic isoform X2 n=1 Tax=Capsella rubella TaxID=81985 RepID=UPI000CD58B79|nr:ribulose bisphosphate carboxylase small chain F1, chloroplastic isoform X2 [Capsella rubella]